MKRRLSLKRLGLGSKFSKISQGLPSPTSPSASTIKLFKAITNPDAKQAPSSVDMQTIARVTFGTQKCIQELHIAFLDNLSSNSPIVVLKTLAVLVFVFKTGSDDFYHFFKDQGKGIWKLKSLVNYSFSKSSETSESIRLKASEAVRYCEDTAYLSFKKEEFKNLRNSISQPTPRSSFDTGRNSFTEGRRSQSMERNVLSREEILKDLKLDDNLKSPVEPVISWQGRLRRLTNINEEDE